MGTNTGTIMTLANSIIGVSVLAMPFCFKQCGIALSILMLIASSLLSRLACHFLLKSAVMARRRTFEFLAFHTFGLTGKFTVELFIIGFLMGTCIAFFVVMGDLGPAIVAKILGLTNTVALRQSVLLGLAAFVVLPLGMLRNVDSLSSVSMATIGFYICLVLKVVGESLPHLLAGDWYEHVNFWRPAGILQCIPIFSMALFCQTQLFEIYESMHNASLDRMNFVIRAACNICTGVYICVGFFGYIAFCTQPFTGNVLMSFTPSVVSEMIKLGFVLSVAVSFPLVIFPCRASLYSLLFRRITMPHHEGVGSHIPETRFKCLTVFIICVALVIGLLIPNIELVLGLVGSTIGVLICVMFPAAAFICMSTKSSNDRLLAQVLLFVGALILVLGTYATLNSANETKSSTEILINEPAPGIVEKSPHFHQKVDNSLVDLPPKLEQKPEPDVKQADEEFKKPPKNDNAQPLQSKELRVESPKVDKRQEPPVPVEPAAPAGNPQPTVIALVKKEKVNEQEKETVKEKIQKDNPEEKNINNDEGEKKEIKSAAEQVDQEAIKKEDDALAEAEKIDSVDNRKNEEILRKLEKHEAQQMKILEEQKQILQALQEHQERDLLKEHQENVEKNVSQNKNNKTLTQVKEPTKIEVPIRQNVEAIKELNEKEQIKNSAENQKIPQKIKQDLLKQIANGELSKPFSQNLPAKEAIPPVSSFQTAEKPIKNNPSDKISFGTNNEVSVAEIKESLHISAPKVEVKAEVPAAVVQPLLLERLKSPPLPLAALQNKTKPFVSQNMRDERPQPEPENGVNAMRREILQEPVPSTQDSAPAIMQQDVKNVPILEGTNQSLREKLHDREKRDIEDTEKTNVNSVELNSAVQLNISNEATSLPENCHITESNVGSELVHKGEMYKAHNQILNQGDSGNSPVMLKTSDPHRERDTLAPTFEPESIKKAQNTSKVEDNTLMESVPLVSNSSSNQQNSPQDANIGNTMIKSATHLSDPPLKSDEGNEVSILRQSVSPDAKPMKRDLKSVSLAEEKSDSRKQE